MHKPLTSAVRAFAFLFLIALLPSLIIASIGPISLASAPFGHGCDGSLNANCGMDNFVPVDKYQVPSGWTPFVVSGSLAIDGPHEDTYWGAPSVRLWSDGDKFDAGLLTQVGGLTPGATYYASMGWGAPKSPEDSFERYLGIDPYGGTDPNSPNVVWGPKWRGPGKVLNDNRPGFINIDVSTVAKASTVTLFVRANHMYSTGQNEIFIDAVGLYRDSGAPVAVVTDTPAPASKPPTTAQPKAPAPTKRPPTATKAPTATRTATPAPTDTPTPTNTPAPTATPTFTPTPADTATPSVTPSSTLPPRPRATTAASESEVASRTAAPHALLLSGLGALAAAGLLSIGMVVRRRS